MIPVSPRFSGKLTTHLSRYSRILSTCFILGTITSQYARAAVTVNFGKDQFFTIGVGVKAQYLSKDPAATPSNSSAASASNLRIYMGAQFHKYVKTTLNLERLRDGNWNVLDGILQIEPWKAFNVWGGRMLTQVIAPTLMVHIS